MAPTYPEVARALLERCAQNRQHSIDLKLLKASVWSAASGIVIPQERATRHYLQQAEGRLDVLEYTVDRGKLGAATLEIVAGIEDEMIRYLDKDTTMCRSRHPES